MTATKTRTKPKSKAAAPHSKKKPAASQPARPTFALLATGTIKLTDLVRSPFQPRREFPESEIEALAESIRLHGQLVPIVVREVPREPDDVWSPPKFELIYGERRMRAARRAGVTELRAEIVEAGDAAVRRAILAETLDRKGLNPIEEAAAFQMALDVGDAAGPTELAQQLGLSQGHVSNRLRLLELPEWWRERLISGEITERHARAALPWMKHTAIAAEIREALERDLREDGQPVGVQAWEECRIPNAVIDATRPMSGGYYDTQRGNVPIFDPEASQRDALGIIEFEGAERATNVPLWEKLQKAFQKSAGRPRTTDAADAAEAACPRDCESCPKQNCPGRGSYPADGVARATEDRLHGAARGADAGREASGRDYAARLWAWITMALRRAIADELSHSSSEPNLLAIAMLALAWRVDPPGEDELTKMIASVAGVRRKSHAIDGLSDCDELSMTHVAGHYLAGLFWREATGPELGVSAENVHAIAAMLGVALEDVWNAGRIAAPQGYFDLHTREQLLALAREVKLHEYLSPIGQAEADPKAVLAACSKADLVDAFLRAMPLVDGDEAGIPCPKEIIRAKPVKRK